MGIPIYQVDAFSTGPFTGNPAAVCLLEHDAPADWMQSVADEMNLSETAFVVRQETGFGLRWFTPAIEVPLCGHATLASAHVLWESEWLAPDAMATFDSRSGTLEARRITRSGVPAIELDFPAIQTHPLPSGESPGVDVDRVLTALGAEAADIEGTPERQLGDWDLLIDVGGPDKLRALTPDFAALTTATKGGVIATSTSDDDRYDFLSRYFACYAGTPEDPVTGSAHCALATYWAKRLGKVAMLGYQASKRGGAVGVEVRGDRVALRGEATTVLQGELVADP